MRIFLLLYAAAFIIVALARVKPWISFQAEIPPLVPGIYLALLAMVSAVYLREKRFPSGLWIKVCYGLALAWITGLLSLTIKALLSKQGDLSDFLCALIVITSILGSVWAARILFLRFTRDEKVGCGWRERSGPILLLGLGALCVLAALIFTITPEGSGWHVLVGRNPWVTQQFNVLNYSSAAENFPWVLSIFGKTGRAAYTFGLISALFVLFALGKARFSPDDVRTSRLLAPIIASNIFFTLYLLQDFYWGAYDGLNTKPWAAWLGAGCWLSGIVFGAWSARLIARGSAEKWHLQALISFQLPFVAVLIFLFADMILIESKGLILLVVGALLQNFGCMILLAEKPEESRMSFARIASFRL